MLAIFSELGGKRFLGKARELADSFGSNVLAVCSERDSESNDSYSQELIALGADEVLVYDRPTNVFQWSEALSSLLNERTQLRYLIGVASPLTDAIFGRVYASNEQLVGAFGTGLDTITESDATKQLRTWEAVLHFGISSDKANLFTFKPFAFPAPFADSSRYGKKSEKSVKEIPSERISETTERIDQDASRDSSGALTILVGNTLLGKSEDSANPILKKVASKYMARIVDYNAKVQEVYGPCLAIEVDVLHERELPRFHGELIALNSVEGRAISRLADTNIVSTDILQVLQQI